MRRSGGMGGRSVLRAVGRAVGSGVAGVKDAVSSTAGAKSARAVVPLASSSGASGSSSVAAAAETTRGTTMCFCDGEEWEAVDGEEAVEMGEEIVISEQFERFVFGPVPSKQEAEDAISTIHQMFVPISLGEKIESFPPEQLEVKDKAVISTSIFPRSLSTGSQSDWIEPAMYLYSSKARHSQEREKVLDAFRLLQINPSVQKVVVSLSSDSAVWDAVMKNEVVQDFKRSLYAGESKPQDPDEGGHAARGITKWILGAKTKIMEVFNKISNHLSQVLCSYGAEYDSDAFHDVLQTSFMLSVMVFIVVVMTRSRKS
ncbi:hypothetical protein KSP39_PZI009734 [Platanthera zijinensis]|uniref:Uncharacterized protein n=1 Tax=Platanthera zijinensis TaxID=2320716 RepID=A0AAP0BKC6_9ASPA